MNAQIQLTIAAILTVFENFRMAPTAIDQYESVGKSVLTDRIMSFVLLNQPIKFSLLGFPMKSPNYRDKVIGQVPDLAEKVALENFATFNNAIKTVYSPGVDIAIISDGLIFSDVMEVSDNTVFQYEEAAIDMARVAPIRWYNMMDFYNHSMRLPEMRQKVMDQFGITPEVLEYRIRTDANVNELYKGMIKFMHGDWAIKDYPSGNQLHKKAKAVAREMMFRNEAYSALIRENFADHIRLSMHNSTNDGTKFSFKLIPGTPDKIWTSPWHCALLIDEVGDYVTIHRGAAIAAGHALMHENGKPFYFQANKTVVNPSLIEY